ncbi:MAG: tyrosine-type recombinase/integrase, partial [Myxococcota bacterium]
MPRKATGSIRFRNGKWEARVTVGPSKRPSFQLPTCRSEEAAQERANLLAELAQRLRKAGHEDLAPQFLERAAARDGQGLEDVVAAVGRLCAGEVAVPGKERTAVTFRELADQWTSGELHRRWPDHVRKKAPKSVQMDRYWLERHVLPIVGDVPLVDFTLEHAERVMASLPEGLAPATRRQVAQLIHRVLTMAAYPARIIPQNPLPRGFMPPARSKKALSYLYPDEDRKLLGCTEVPLGHRVLYGFLAREGMRRSEAGRLTWADVDLERGAVTLDTNKTNDPRAWALRPDVVAALEAWRKLLGEPERAAPVFVAADGGALEADHQAELFREHLRTAGVDREALYARTEHRLPIRLHDLRATFITIALATGRSEAWVMDRTGHRTSQMLNRYRRAARSMAELDLGGLAPMVHAIPELAALARETGRETGRGSEIEGGGVLSDAGEVAEIAGVRTSGVEPPRDFSHQIL